MSDAELLEVAVTIGYAQLLLDVPKGMHIDKAIRIVMTFGYGGLYFNGVLIRRFADDTAETMMDKWRLHQ